jgi:hypothetical protein
LGDLGILALAFQLLDDMPAIVDVRFEAHQVFFQLRRFIAVARDLHLQVKRDFSGAHPGCCGGDGGGDRLVSSVAAGRSDNCVRSRPFRRAWSAAASLISAWLSAMASNSTIRCLRIPALLGFSTSYCPHRVVVIEYQLLVVLQAVVRFPLRFERAVLVEIGDFLDQGRLAVHDSTIAALRVKSSLVRYFFQQRFEVVAEFAISR